MLIKRQNLLSTGPRKWSKHWISTGPGILDLLIWTRETQHDLNWPIRMAYLSDLRIGQRWTKDQSLVIVFIIFTGMFGMIKSGSHFLWLENPCSPSLDCLLWSCSQGQEISWGKKTESSKTKNISALFESLDPTWVEFHNLEITVQLASINSS